MQNLKNILITGASSGIGRALAISYSNAEVNLFLCARNEEKLLNTKRLCEELKAKVYIKILDVTDYQSCFEWINEITENYQIDLVIANAGISAGTAGGVESFQQIKQIFDTNLYGVLNIINPIVQHMKNKKSGQIAIISSLAGFRGLPSSPAYSASKAAVRVYGEGLRGNLAEFGIKVNVVCPGYVKTPMTAVNNFFMPWILEVNEAAKIIKVKLSKNKSRISFPFPLYFVIWFLTMISTSITDPIFAKLPKKKSLNE